MARLNDTPLQPSATPFRSTNQRDLTPEPLAASSTAADANSRTYDNQHWPSTHGASSRLSMSMDNPTNSTSWSTHPDRRRLTRQNRDLAKSNNYRGLRIRELETEQTFLLSQNLTLQTRILELEHETARDGARRIAEHALQIKAKLEAQLGEWSAVLAGLGTEPRQKSCSQKGRVSKENGGRRSTLGGERASLGSQRRWSLMRPSPSQRRLRDVANQIEELGHIPESRPAQQRLSMDFQDIMALQARENDLRFDNDSGSPELGPPPMSRFVDEKNEDEDDDDHEHARLSFSPMDVSTRSLRNLQDEFYKAKADTPSPFSSPLDPAPRSHPMQKDKTGEDRIATSQTDDDAKENSTVTNTDATASPTPQRSSCKSSAVAALFQKLQSPGKRLSPRAAAAAAVVAAADSAILAPPSLLAPARRSPARLELETTDIKPRNPSSQQGVKRKANTTSDENGNDAIVDMPKAKKRASSGAISRSRASKLQEVLVEEASEVGLPTVSEAPPNVVTRQPLAVKSTNEDVTHSPVKKSLANGKDMLPELVKPIKNIKDRKGKRTSTTLISIPAEEAPTRPVSISMSPLPCPASPTPPPQSIRVSTPPPASDSSRPSRRARATISYAEPNLRDKMRRGSKEPGDAVGPVKPASTIVDLAPALDAQVPVQTTQAATSHPDDAEKAAVPEPPDSSTLSLPSDDSSFEGPAAVSGVSKPRPSRRSNAAEIGRGSKKRTSMVGGEDDAPAGPREPRESRRRTMLV